MTCNFFKNLETQTWLSVNCQKHRSDLPSIPINFLWEQKQTKESIKFLIGISKQGDAMLTIKVSLFYNCFINCHNKGENYMNEIQG